MTINPDNALLFLYLAAGMVVLGFAIFYHATYKGSYRSDKRK